MKAVNALALIAAAAITPLAHAEVLFYQNAANMAGAGPSYGTTLRTADDFQIWAAPGNQANINRINAYMLTNQGVDVSKYFIEIYADNAGAPGALVYSRPFASEVYDVGWAPMGQKTMYVVFTNMDIPLNVNTRYWLSVAGTDTGTGFATANTRPYSLSSGQFRDASGQWVEASASDPILRDYAFDINGTVSPMVPAPGAAGLLGVGALTLARRRHR